jgi:hypothetical protein
MIALLFGARADHLPAIRALESLRMMKEYNTGPLNVQIGGSRSEQTKVQAVGQVQSLCPLQVQNDRAKGRFSFRGLSLATFTRSPFVVKFLQAAGRRARFWIRMTCPASAGLLFGRSVTAVVRSRTGRSAQNTACRLHAWIVALILPRRNRGVVIKGHQEAKRGI